MAEWSVYVIRTRRGTLYTGIAKDVDHRLAQHRAGRGAKYLRKRSPLRLVYRLELGDQSLALRVEYRIKQLQKSEKEELLAASPSRCRLLRMLGLRPKHPIAWGLS